MKILVGVKRVIDYNVHIRVRPDGSAIETDHVKMSTNPFDEIALEEAVRLKEQNKAEEIIVVSIGSSLAQETLRSALAMGADRALLIETINECQPLAIAKILAKIVLQEKIACVFLGKQAIDGDDNQVGQMLAGLLNWPQATFASKVVCENNSLTVTREVDGGLEILCVQLPAIVTADLRLNQPRYLSLPNIVRAKQKPLTVISVDTLNVDIAPRFSVLKLNTPPRRRKGVKLNSVTELVEQLRSQGVLA